jgi:hypothetical protein
MMASAGRVVVIDGSVTTVGVFGMMKGVIDEILTFSYTGDAWLLSL